MITRGQRFGILIFRPKGPTRLLRVIPRAIAAYRESVADPAQGNDKAGVDAGDLTASQLCLFMPVGTCFFFLSRRTHHEHHRQIPRAERCGRGADNEGGDGHPEGEGDVPISLAGSVGVPGVKERDDKAKRIRWGRQEQRRDVVVAECLHDRREEVGDGTAGNDTQDDDQLEREPMISISAYGC